MTNNCSEAFVVLNQGDLSNVWGGSGHNFWYDFGEVVGEFVKEAGEALGGLRPEGGPDMGNLSRL